MLFKSLEFKNMVGQKVKIMEIPVLEEGNPHYFMIQLRLQTFMTTIYSKESMKKCYSFKDHLKRILRWPEYEDIFSPPELKNNA